MTIYQQLSLECTVEQANVIEEILQSNGSLSISLLEDPDEPIFEPALNTTPLWSKLTMVALFEKDKNLEPVIAVLALALGQHFSYQCEILEDRDWVSETQANFQPQCYQNKLWVYPDWYEVPEEHQPVIKISPGLAFGTGNHATTQMCLDQLCLSVKPGDVVVDFGCGSGILALAAIALGAEQVYAIDIDPQALDATRANANLNNINPEKLLTFLPERAPHHFKADIVVANILAQPLIDLKQILVAHMKLTGKIILSGLLASQAKDVLTAYQPILPLKVLQQMEEWSCVGN